MIPCRASNFRRVCRRGILTSMRTSSRLPTALACVLAAGMSATTFAQLASRPADEWKKTLEQSSRVDNLKVDEIVSRVALKPGQVVADLGAGTGLFDVPLAKAVGPMGRVYAVDIDKGFFPQIDEKAQQQHVANIKTVLGEFADPKLPVRDVDLAFMHDVLHHVQDRATYLKNATRYLKPSGRFVVVDYRPESSPHKDQPDLVVSEEQATAWMKAAGLGKVDRVALFPDKYFLIFSR
jgi:ubiquinone/menaquinone biosynthesis C-methylase UbiE